MKNYYEILGITPGASKMEIEKAFQKLSKEFHPDNNEGISFFNTLFKEIQEAYKILSNETLKTHYDKQHNFTKVNSPKESENFNSVKQEPEYSANGTIKKETLKNKNTTAKIFFIISLLLAGYFFYINYFASSYTEEAISYEDKIEALLRAEDARNFNEISFYYASNVNRYWDSQYLDKEDLKEEYNKAWKLTSDSKNNIIGIKRVKDKIYDVETEFSFINNKTNQPTSNISVNRYVFNEEGLLNKVFNIEHKNKYEKYRDSDFSRITNEEKIRRLIAAEDNRDFNKIASFYSPKVDRYWHLENVTIPDIKQQYENAWRITSYSKNYILDIVPVGNNIYELNTRFVFQSTNKTELEEKFGNNIFVFNEKGEITEVYGNNNF